MKVSSYLIFNGQAEEATKFYADMLGGTTGNLYRYGDFPPMDGMPTLTEAEKRLVGHTCVSFGNGESIGLADTLPSDPRTFGTANMHTLVTDSEEQAKSAWEKLSVGAKKIACPLAPTFYAQLYGELTDRFGVLWAVMYEGKNAEM